MSQLTSPVPKCNTEDGVINIDTLIQQLHTEIQPEQNEKCQGPGPGPIALIQFRIWESGRVDMAR